jgi:glycosyltransferase involved in cell wall biosynthesis
MTARQPAAPRALLVCDYFIRYVTGLAQGLRANSWDPVLLSRDHDDAFGGESGAMRRYLQQRLGPEPPFVCIEGRIRQRGAWGSLRRARAEIRRLQPEIVHAQYCIGHDPRLSLAAGLRPGRFALTVHDVDPHPGEMRSPVHHWTTQRALIFTAGVVFVHAEQLREQLLARRLVRGPVIVVPHGIDAADPRPLPREPSLLFFGRIQEYKGLSVLLDALARLWCRRPDATLTIAGEGPLPTHPVLDDARVRLLHRHIREEEIPGLFAEASVVVLPYLEASQSGVGSLAKTYGRPLLASAVGGLPELLADGSGVLVAPGDADVLADRLAELLDDRERLERLGAAGLRSVEENAGWPVVAALTAEAYARYLGAPRPRVASARASAIA